MRRTILPITLVGYFALLFLVGLIAPSFPWAACIGVGPLIAWTVFYRDVPARVYWTHPRIAKAVAGDLLYLLAASGLAYALGVIGRKLGS